MDKDNQVGSALFYVGVLEGEVIVTDDFEAVNSIIPEFSSLTIRLVFLMIVCVLFYRKRIKK
jgi:hypothetical protein